MPPRDGPGQAFGLRLPLRNVVLSTDKKPAPTCNLQASKTLPSPHRNFHHIEILYGSEEKQGFRPGAASAQPCFLNSQKPSSKLQPSNLQNVGFRQETSSNLQPSSLQIAAVKPPKCCLRHSETPWPHQAFSLRLPVPNVTFRTDKKPDPPLQAFKQNIQIAAFKPSKTLPSPQRNTMPPRDGPGQAFGLRLPRLTSYSQPTRNEFQIATFKPRKRCLRHSEAPCHGGPDQAFGLRLPVPNIASQPTTNPAPNCNFQASNRCLRPLFSDTLHAVGRGRRILASAHTGMPLG